MSMQWKRRAFLRRMAFAALSCSMLDLDKLMPRVDDRFLTKDQWVLYDVSVIQVPMNHTLVWSDRSNRTSW